MYKTDYNRDLNPFKLRYVTLLQVTQRHSLKKTLISYYNR